jgi:hypothetical protein
MASKTERAVSIAVLLAVTLTLTACMGHWFTPPQLAKLIVGPPVAKGGRYEVLISVADMPNGGVAGIQLGTVALPAIEFANVDVSTLTAEGLSGFRVTAESYTAGPPAKGSLMAVYGGVAVVSGQVLKLSFEATGNPTVTLDETRIALASAVPGWIVGWDLEAGVAYYTKEAGER